MNEETNNPFEVVGDNPLEARIVAWVLGEASPFEAEELERLCKEMPELEIFRRRIEAVHGLAGEALKPRTGDWKLPPEKRAKVFASIGAVEVQQRRERVSRWASRRAVWMMAACFVLTAIVAVLVFPLFFARAWKKGSPEAAARMKERMVPLETPLPPELLEGTPSAVQHPLADAPAASRRRFEQHEFTLPSAGPAGERGRSRVLTEETLRELAGEKAANSSAAEANAPRSAAEQRDVASRVAATTAPPPPPVATMPAPEPAAADPFAAPSAEKLAEHGRAARAPLAGAAIPVPEVPLPEPSADLGAADDFGDGWGGGSGGGGGGAPAGGRASEVNGDAITPDHLAKKAEGKSTAAALQTGELGSDHADRYRSEQKTDAPASAGMRSGDAGVARGNLDNILHLAGRDGRAGAGIGNGTSPTGGAVASGSALKRDDENPLSGKDAFPVTPATPAAKAPAKPASTASGLLDGVPVVGGLFNDEAKPGEAREKEKKEVDAAWELGTPGQGQAKARPAESKPAATGARPLQPELAQDTERLKRAQELRDEKKDAMIRRSVDTHDYVEATKDFEQSQAMLEQMRLKYQGERIQLKVPRNPIVLHEEPKTAEKPGWFSFDRRYRAEAVVQVTPTTPETAAVGKTGAESATDATAQQFFGTEFEVIKAQKTLEKVVDSLDLTSRWGVSKDEALKKLKDSIETERVKGSDLVAIRAKSDKPEESKEIALEVTKAYQARRAQLESERAGKALEELNKALREQEDRVEEKRKVLNTIIKTKGIPYRGADDLIPEEGVDEDEVVARASGVMDSRNYDVPSNFAGQLANGRATQAGVAQLLQESGVALPEGSKVILDGRKLSVTAPAAELDRIGALVGRMKPGPQDVLDLMAEVSAAKEPWSTFSLHVSDASFRVAQAAFARGQRPDKESVRPEEFYNAFDYGDPAPSAGEPVACAVEQAAHPLLPGRNLVRIAVRTGSAGRGTGQPLRLTVLLDNSGSMEREDRRAATREAMARLVSLLGPDDLVTVAGFSRQPRLLADRMAGPEAQAKLVELIAKTPPEGGTNLEAALRLGEELALRQQVAGAQNRMVLLTDGAANLGNANPKVLAERIEGLRQRGIAFDAAGIGADGMNDTMLEALTRDGNGRYYVIDGPQDADEAFAKKLAGAFRPAAENVKVQVHFNPARVSRYRLIGFEEHRLKKEDFRNDAVDAAELAAEEAGVALYQVELSPQGEGEIGEVSVRFRDTAAGRMVERTWTIPHDASAPAFDTAKPSIQLAGLAAMAADVLREGPLAQMVDFGQLAPVTAKVRAAYGNNERVARLLEMWERLRR